MSTFISIDLLIDIMEEDRPGCFNGAYVGDDYWEEERYTDMVLRKERRSFRKLTVESQFKSLKV